MTEEEEGHEVFTRWTLRQVEEGTSCLNYKEELGMDNGKKGLSRWRNWHEQRSRARSHGCK